MELITIDIKSERQTVAEALAQFQIEAESYKMGGYKVMKVIHGYGSHGVGGAIKPEFLKLCKRLKGQNKIYDYVCCENWTPTNVVRKMAINYCADLLADKDLYLLNPGCTIIIL